MPRRSWATSRQDHRSRRAARHEPSIGHLGATEGKPVGRYDFRSPGADARNAIEQLLMQRALEARQQQEETFKRQQAEQAAKHQAAQLALQQQQEARVAAQQQQRLTMEQDAQQAAQRAKTNEAGVNDML